ncbi:MAG: lamin tail domain-containing protein [Alphaproteobacteria bacterium]|nr:lamin tail domain-containing protein [Alphaproteobacteria bacterium]
MRIASLVVLSLAVGCSEYGVSNLTPLEPEVEAEVPDVVEDEPVPEAPTQQEPESDPPAQQPEPDPDPEPESDPEPEPLPPVVTIAQPGDLVFSELMINPEVVSDDMGEWVELYNTASYPIDVSGYTFHDLDYDSWELSGPFIVPPGGYYVLCAETDASLNGGVPCDGWFQRVSLGGGLALANVPDEVVLSRPDGVEIDRLEYDETWFTNGVAIGVDPSALDEDGNDDLDAWCDQVSVVSTGGEPGTPGQANDPCW